MRTYICERRRIWLISTLGAYQEKIKKKTLSEFGALWEQMLNRTSEWPSFQPESILGASVSAKSCRHLISSYTRGKKKRLSGGCQPICVNTGDECFKFSGTNQRQRGEKEVYTWPFTGKQTQVLVLSQWQVRHAVECSISHTGTNSPNFESPRMLTQIIFILILFQCIQDKTRYQRLLITLLPTKADV